MIKSLATFSLLAVTLLAQDNYKTLDKTYSYSEAIESCEAIGDEWRLGEIWELFYLKGETEKFDKKRVYWSSTALKKIDTHPTNEAFTFYLKDGTMQTAQQANKHHVICTNLSKIPQTQRNFRKTANGVVDKLNKILWEKTSQKHLNKKLSLKMHKSFVKKR